MDIRKEFLEYFKKKQHLVLPSSGLIPENDDSVDKPRDAPPAGDRSHAIHPMAGG